MEAHVPGVTEQTWAFLAELENTRRPVAWSKASIIYSAHVSRPSIEAIHFPSKRPVLVPQPSIIQQMPFNYRSPTLLSLSPCDVWLSAYFPGIAVPGVCCLWRRGDEIDCWVEKEWWHLAHGDAPITAEWLNNNREWVNGPTGAPIRLPLRGPYMPSLDPALLLVTQSCRVFICTYHRKLPPNPREVSELHFKIHHCSLLEPGTMVEHPRVLSMEPDHMHDTSWAGGAEIAIMSAIGMQYGESAILVATRTSVTPLWSNNHDPLQMLSSDPAFLGVPATLSDVLGEQDNIRLCEVSLRLELKDPMGPIDFVMGTQPLPFIATTERRLTHLLFVPSISRKASSSSAPRELYLLTASVDTDDASRPSTELVIYGITKNHVTTSAESLWSVQNLALRTLATTIVLFILKLVSSRLGTDSDYDSGKVKLAIGTTSADPADHSLPTKGRKTRVGEVKLFSIPELEEDVKWSPVPIPSADSAYIVNAPMYAALSPNSALVCLADDLAVGTRIIPMPTSKGSESPEAVAAGILSVFLKSIQAHSIPSDVIGYFVSSSTTKDSMDSALVRLVEALCPNGNDCDSAKLRDAMGVILVVRRAAAALTNVVATDSIRFVQDVCSIITSNTLFASHQLDESRYNLNSIWSLISSSAWFARFLEDLARECVYLLDHPSEDASMKTPLSQMEQDDADLFGSAPPTPAVETNPTAIPPPVKPTQKAESFALLLHLVHPTLLQNISKLVRHIVRLKKQIFEAAATTPNANMAKDIYTDLFGSLGVDIEVLQPVLMNLLQDASKAHDDHLRLSLVICRPAPQLQDMALSAGRKYGSCTAVDKMKLFLRTADLADAQLFSTHAGRDSEDIVTKSALGTGTISRCTRCDGRTHATGSLPRADMRGSGSSLWWWSPCVCGGDWSRI